MRLDAHNGPETESTSTDSLSFGISQGNIGLILDILRSKIYEDPIGSICREIASNARDANREVGKGDTPITITLVKNNPFLNAGNETIVFTDNGPGMDRDTLRDVYTQFGESTRRDSNDFTGGFGLGAKTPFAYTDSFTVISTVKGERSHWVCYIDETKCGSMDCLFTETTEDSDGVSVCIPLQKYDSTKFQTAVINNTLFWDVRPTLEDFSSTYPSLEEIISEDTYAVYTKDYNRQLSQFIVLIDGIGYKIDDNILNSILKYSSDTVVVMPFNNGELSISANRETLHLNEATKSKIIDRALDIQNTIKSKVETHLDDMPTRLDAAVALNRISKGPSYNIGPFSDDELALYRLMRLYPTHTQFYQYKGSVLHTSYLLGYHTLHTVSDTNPRLIHQNSTLTVTHDFITHNNLYYLDAARRDRKKEITALESVDRLFIIRPKAADSWLNTSPTEYAAKLAEEKAFIKDYFGLNDYSKIARTNIKLTGGVYNEVSSLSVRKIAYSPTEMIGNRYTSITDTSKRRNSYSPSSMYVDTVYWNKAEQKFTDDNINNCIYLNVLDFKSLSANRRTISQGLFCAKYLGKTFIICGNRNGKYFEKVATHVDQAWEAILPLFSDMISATEAKRVYEENSRLTELSFGIENAVGSSIALLATKMALLTTMLVGFQDIDYINMYYPDKNVTVSDAVTTATDVLNNVNKTYPLLKYCQTDHRKYTDHFNLYINAVESELLTKISN